MNTRAPAANPDNIKPAVHLEFIQNQLDNPGTSKPEEVENYHRALFLHHHAVEWEVYRQAARTHQDALAFLEGRLKETELRLSGRAKLVPATVDGQEDIHPTSPWNTWDITMAVLSCAGIAALIAFGVLNISFNLLESGFVTFRENPWRSYFWAALLPVGALGVKVGWDFLQAERHRKVYLWACLALGVGGVLVWVMAYACVYPTLSKGIDEQIATLTVFDQAGSGAASGLNFAGAKWIDVVTVAAQAVAEIFLSAALGMHLTNLYARHRPVRLASDPAVAQMEQERRSLLEEVARERARYGEAAGHLVRLENQLAGLLAYGKSILHREAARRQDGTQRRQVILSELSDHIRNHLETADPAGRISLSSENAGHNGG